VAEGACIGLLIPNLFLRVSVDTAVRAAGAQPVPYADAEGAAASDCPVLIVDLDALGGETISSVRALLGTGKVVLAFGPHVRGDLLAGARAAGAVVLPRSAFLQRLPELLETALGQRRSDRA
jgi:hypothetical protein